MGRVIHFENYSSDLDRGEKFSTGVFGWPGTYRNGASIDYRSISSGTAAPEDTEGSIFGAVQPIAA